MQGPESREPTTGIAPIRGQGDGQIKLQALFTEVTVLARQLRKRAVFAHEERAAMAGRQSILRVLNRLGPQTVPGIARVQGLSRQSVQTQVNRLQEHGYVSLAPNPAHKRSGLVELTNPGRHVLAAVMERERDALEPLLPHISEGRLAPAIRLLRRIRELLARKSLPAQETVAPDSTYQGAQRPAKPVQRRKPAPAPRPPEFPEPDENELPVSLL